MSPRQIEILKSEVNKMLELKIIEPGESDFTSPLILVEAQRKEARPCIDYRRLNKVTRTQFFPLPNIKELLEKVSAAKYISILDLTRGLPFGLKNAPYYFSRLMANLLRNCEDFAVPYLDDIAIFSLAWDDHLKHLKDVFDRLRSAKLHIKPSKCKFAQAYVKYLGHLVGQGLRTPGELKARKLRDWSIEYWKQIAWSDESRFRLLNAEERLRIWRQAHEVMDPAFQVGTAQGRCGSIMVWGVFLWHCLGSLVRVPTYLNANHYVEFLGITSIRLCCSVSQVPVGYWLVGRAFF
ncbi:hypothetical protein TNCV_3144351 [Trichonephila clavipes]|nr:hypothetical protein TNCV_3144351 [Trichonephila clavipes]